MESTRIFRTVTLAMFATFMAPAAPAIGQTAPPSHRAMLAETAPVRDGFTAFVRDALPSGDGNFDVFLARLSEAVRRPASLRALPSHERLIAIDARNRIIHVTDGMASMIDLVWELEIQLTLPSAGIVMVHNHPRSNGLSCPDFAQFTAPGVAAVVAVGHDGSLYSTTSAPGTADTSMTRRIIPAACNEIARQLRMARPQGRADGRAFDDHMSHLVSLALEKAGIVEYRFLLAPGRAKTYARQHAFFERIADESASNIRDSLLRLTKKFSK